MLKKILTNLYVLLFLNGVLLTTIYFYRAEDLYERDLFDGIVKNVKDSLKSDNKDSFLLTSLQLTHELLHQRQLIFQAVPIATVTSENFLVSVRKDLMASKGACGSNARVLARILKAYNFETRIGQMQSDGRFGSHILVEAKSNNKWVVLDPLYNLYFKNPDGSLASFEQVHQNWAYFRNQVPPDYDTAYRYEGIRYTNWNKIPVLMPLAKKVLDMVLGKERADSICLRTSLLRIHHILYVVYSFVYILLTLFIFRLLYRQRKVKQHGLT